MQVQPYLNFDGRCEEAIDFYRQALGAKVEMMLRNKENPQPPPPGSTPPGNENKILHASVRIGDTVIGASDGYCTGKLAFQGITLTLQVANEGEADRLFNALANGGQVQLQLTRTFFSPRFGMVADRFGVAWMVYVVQAPTA
jgi:PhnB protein